MDKEKMEFYLQNQTMTSNGSDSLMLNLIKSISEIASKDLIITEANLELFTKPRTAKQINGDMKSVTIDKKNIQCLDIFCKNPSAVGNLLTLLEFYYDLKIIMNVSMYERFRHKFTEIYHDAFGSVNKNPAYTYDSDDINKLLSVREINYKIIMLQDKEGFWRWMLVKSNEPIMFRKVDTYYALDNIDESNSSFDNLDFQNLELENFLRLNMKINPSMDIYAFTVFTKQFALLYNELYKSYHNIGERDLFDIDEFNYILETRKSSYRIVKNIKNDSDNDNTEWFIMLVD